MFKRFSTHKNNAILEQLIARLREIAQSQRVLVLCPDTTGYSWMGINRATKALFPTNTIALPQYYSNSIFSEKELNQLIAVINSLHIEQLILSGFPLYFEKLVTGIQSAKIKVIYHGFFSEFAQNETQQQQFDRLIELAKTGKITTIAFNKKGMAESIHALWGINTQKIILSTVLPPEFIPENPRQESTQPIKIGVLANDQFRKNLYNQLVGAALIPATEIHVTSSNEFTLLPETIQVVKHPTGQEHTSFLKLVGSMDVNLHCSYSESWGQITTESLALGVPCLIANHSDIYDYNAELKELLVIDDYDNSWAIKERIEEMLRQKNTLRTKCINYIEQLNQLSAETINSFLNV
jgi:glycosyltransferase involved in cell wall biosynthesis